jgi:hypothetical protein
MADGLDACSPGGPSAEWYQLYSTDGCGNVIDVNEPLITGLVIVSVAVVSIVIVLIVKKLKKGKK